MRELFALIFLILIISHWDGIDRAIDRALAGQCAAPTK